MGVKATDRFPCGFGMACSGARASGWRTSILHYCPVAGLYRTFAGYTIDRPADLHNHMVVDRLSTSFIALSDPTRRLILERLANGAASVNELAEPFHISQQAVSKHLAYLERADLIEKRREGRQQLCTLKRGSLDEVVAWVQKCREFWEDSFDQLELLVKEMKAKEKKSGRGRK
jgi:DNA-binding transcriptional ArsR family regulator